MGMSEFYGPTDDASSLRALHAAYDLGYRHFDTADLYGSGHNEELLSRFLRELGGARREVFVATKGGIKRLSGPTPGIRADSSRENLLKACDASLKRLGVDYIDIYYLHRRSPDVPIEETVGALAELVAAGKVRHIGLSEVSANTLRRACQVHPIAALQSEYSLWSRDPELEILGACAELGVNLVAYSPLGRGFLTGKLEPERFRDNQDLRQHLPRFQPAQLELNRALLPALVDLASELDASPAQVAIAWVLAKAQHLHVIPGSRSPARIAENFGASRVALTGEHVARLDSAFAPSGIAGSRYPEHLLSTVNL